MATDKKKAHEKSSNCPFDVNPSLEPAMASWLNSWISLIFILFALVQLNDEDFFIWVPIYLIPAILNTVFLFYDPSAKPHSMLAYLVKVVMFLHSQVCIVMSIYLVWNKKWFGADSTSLGGKDGGGSSRKRETGIIDLLTDPYFEIERELGGLWICLFWIHRFWPETKTKGNRSKITFARKKL